MVIDMRAMPDQTMTEDNAYIACQHLMKREPIVYPYSKHSFQSNFATKMANAWDYVIEVHTNGGYAQI